MYIKNKVKPIYGKEYCVKKKNSPLCFHWKITCYPMYQKVTESLYLGSVTISTATSMFSEVLTISAITAWKWGPEQPSPSLRTKVCKHTFCWIPAYFYVNLAGDEKSTNFSAVVSLLFKTMCHLPQGFTTEQGIQRVAKCFFFFQR